MRKQLTLAMLLLLLLPLLFSDSQSGRQIDSTYSPVAYAQGDPPPSCPRPPCPELKRVKPNPDKHRVGTTDPGSGILLLSLALILVWRLRA